MVGEIIATKQFRKKINYRVLKRLHKKYRLYGADIWGRIGIKRKCNFITRSLYNINQYRFSRRSAKRKLLKRGFRIEKEEGKRKYAVRIGRTSKGEKERQGLRINKGRKYIIKRLLKYRWMVQSVNDASKFFLYKLMNKSRYTRRKPISFRGRVLRYRRMISLFYGGGRIRKKTFRRYGRMLRVDHKRVEDPGSPRGYSSFASIIESRIDVLLFRSNFVDTIYQARQLVFYGGVKVQGYKVVKNPGFLVKIWVPSLLRDDIWKNMRLNLYKRIVDNRVIGFPEYLFINFAVMLAFKMREPRASELRYPFSYAGYDSSAVFRHAFRVL